MFFEIRRVVMKHVQNLNKIFVVIKRAEDTISKKNLNFARRTSK